MDKKELATQAVELIRKLSAERSYTFMHVCGTHEQSITKHGLRAILPKNVRLISGPGCPVCVTPAKEVDAAVELARQGITLLTYGDMFRVPGSRLSLAQCRAEGADVRIVLGIEHAIEIATAEKDKEFVFFSPGLDTTAPSVAAAVLRGLPENLSILNSLRLTVPVMELLLGIGDLHFQGYIAPGHVSAIIGASAYTDLAESYSMPVVVAGFEPMDVLIAVAMLIKQVNSGVARVENEYSRVVKWEGNLRAKKAVEKVFKVVTGEWRGIGRVPFSKLEFREEYSNMDAMQRYKVKTGKSRDLHPACSCHLVITGRIEPVECKLFAEVCTPLKPYGPCMVSQEGTCNIYYRFGEYARA